MTRSSARTTARTSKRATLAFAGMLVGNACLAVGPWFVRLARDPGGVGPIGAGFWRLALAAPLLLLLAGIGADAAHPVLPRGQRRSFVLLLALGGLFFALDLAAWHAGIMRTRLANATLFGNVSSFLFALYGFMLARTRPSATQLLALLLAAIGTALLLGRSYELSARNFAGDLLCILAGLFYMVYLVAVDRTRAEMRPLPVLAAATLAGIVPLWLAAELIEGHVLPHRWGALVALALGSQVLGQGLIVFAIGVLSPVVIGLGLLTQPITGGLIGWLVYGEVMGPPDLAGAAAIAVALILVRRTAPAPPPLPPAGEPLSSGA